MHKIITDAMEDTIKGADGDLSLASRTELTDLLAPDENVMGTSALGKNSTTLDPSEFLSNYGLTSQDLAELYAQFKLTTPSAIAITINGGTENQSYLIVNSSTSGGRGTYEDTYIMNFTLRPGGKVYVNTLKVSREVRKDIYSQTKAILDTNIAQHSHSITHEEDGTKVQRLYAKHEGAGMSPGIPLRHAITHFRYVNLIKDNLSDTEKAAYLLNRHVHGDKREPNLGQIGIEQTRQGAVLTLNGYDRYKVPVNFVGYDAPPDDRATFAEISLKRASHSRNNGY
ncbi:hypothetical protein ACFLZ6_02485, partial [Nanoarchaeota archaeon]